MPEISFGLIYCDAGGKAEFGISFPESRESELVSSDGAAEVNGDLPEFKKFRIADQIANRFSRWMIKD